MQSAVAKSGKGAVQGAVQGVVLVRWRSLAKVLCRVLCRVLFRLQWRKTIYSHRPQTADLYQWEGARDGATWT